MCIALKLDGTQQSIDSLDWHLSNGYTIVDRFDLGGSFVIIMKKEEGSQ
jgi:hypothetical protein